MVKLIRNLEYAEIWCDDDEITEHTGLVGEIGSRNTRKIGNVSEQQIHIQQFTDDHLARGYRILNDDDLFEIIVQFKIDGFGSESDLEMRHRVEDILDDSLGWTGNGHCDGGDIGSGTVNVYCFVVNVDKALQTILDSLDASDVDGEALVAQVIDDEHTVLFPPGGTFQL